MTHKFAIDFGTTNSVIARWNETMNAVDLISIPELSAGPAGDPASIVPSLVYVQDGQTGRLAAGQAVRDQGLDRRKDNRLFRNFKRALVASPTPDARLIDGALWADRDAGRSFLSRLIQALPCAGCDVDQLVLTAPVASFESYLTWLNEAIGDVPPEKVRIVDEATAAALGYAITEPGALALVFDFGGGTLDLSLVQLPDSREHTGGFLDRLRSASQQRHTARVVAKGGRVLGGSDIDQWLLLDVLRRLDLDPQAVGSDYAALLTACERAKIALSTAEEARVAFEVAGHAHEVCVTRDELESLMAANGFFDALRRTMDKVMHLAHRQGIFREDVDALLLVGGVSLMPSVRCALAGYFADVTIRADKPFTAVAEGALQLALGSGLDDYLAHSYGLRHLDPETGEHRYEEIIALGSRYPIDRPIEITLGAAHADQREVEFVIGEIDDGDVSMIEVQYEDGQAVFVARPGEDRYAIQPLNEAEAARARVPLDPPGVPGEDRLKVEFRVDEQRRLCISVTDLQTHRRLLHDAVLAVLH